MINANDFLDFLEANGVGFFTGVPDSLLQSFCVTLFNKYAKDNKHIVAVNEGNGVALAAGYQLATGKIPLVYLQNSGLGNIMNPAASLTDSKVYSIPIVYVIGWRGEPGVNDEPQHLKQGSITCRQLDVLDIPYFVIDKETTLEDIEKEFSNNFKSLLTEGKSVAFVVRKNSFEKIEEKFPPFNSALNREDVIKLLSDKLDDNDFIISTTGKISRELFEHRKNVDSPFKGREFLTVGSMGHASAIALSVSLNHPDKRIWCFDGDGALLMHMGSLATIGTSKVNNLIHVVLNNGSHESVGGMPTVASSVDFCGIAKSCGYPKTIKIENEKQLNSFLNSIGKINQLTFVEIVVSSDSRVDLIRPDTTPIENKESFMKNILRK